MTTFKAYLLLRNDIYGGIIIQTRTQCDVIHIWNNMSSLDCVVSTKAAKFLYFHKHFATRNPFHRGSEKIQALRLVHEIMVTQTTV